jgi:hypothetical protein
MQALQLRRWWCVVALACISMACTHVPLSSVQQGITALSTQGFAMLEDVPGIKAWWKVKATAAQPGASTVPVQPRVLRVYLEGDGAAWWAQRIPPIDPTPRTSVAMPLALSDAHDAVAYLARPCQFLTDLQRQSCPVGWWTTQRWGEAVVARADQALTRLREVSGAQALVLVGHSGGGTLAVLLAARRQDVRCVVTLASPLDTRTWLQVQGLPDLPGSLNPADLPEQVTRFAQVHLQGAEDRVVPPASLGRYGARLRADQWSVLTGVGHSREWVTQWPAWQDARTPVAQSLSACLEGT